MKILIADDSRTGRHYIMKILKIAGVQEADIQQATNGKEAIEILEKGEIKMLFLDLNMPIINGVEVINYMNSKYLTKNMQTIITSSLIDEERINALKNMGIDYFLKKPFTPEALNLIWEKLK